MTAAPGGIVVVGASLAGLRAAEELRHQGFAGTITVIGDEPHLPYDRPPLSKKLSVTPMGRVCNTSSQMPASCASSDSRRHR